MRGLRFSPSVRLASVWLASSPRGVHTPGRLAQMARALPLQGRGRRFKSVSAHGWKEHQWKEHRGAKEPLEPLEPLGRAAHRPPLTLSALSAPEESGSPDEEDLAGLGLLEQPGSARLSPDPLYPADCRYSYYTRIMLPLLPMIAERSYAHR